MAEDTRKIVSDAYGKHIRSPRARNALPHDSREPYPSENKAAPNPYPENTTDSPSPDHIAAWYLKWTTTTPSPRQRYTSKLLSLLPPTPHILELGCGPGVPILEYLLSHNANVTANDISPAQIALAQSRCPTATFVPGDMTALSFPGEIFDGVVSFFTLFHIPRSELGKFLEKVHEWMKLDGVFVFNLATIDEEEIHGEMMGRGMFWSSFDVNDSRTLIERVGFEVLEMEIVKAGEGNLKEDDPDYDTEFVWFVVRRRKKESQHQRTV